MRQRLFLFFLLSPVMLSLVTSCASIPGRGPDAQEDHIKAENRMMNKNLDLALRENEVLKTENIRYKSEVTTLNGKIVNLNAQIEFLNKKYNEDMKQMNERHEDLCLRFESLERESDATIAELIDINLALEKKNADEISKFKGLLQAQEASFNSERDSLTTERNSLTAERDSLKAELKSRMMEMENQLASVKEVVREKDAAILLLEEKLKKASELAVHFESVVRERDETLQRKDREYQELASDNDQRKAEIAEKQAKIDELTKKLPPAEEPSKPITPESINKSK